MSFPDSSSPWATSSDLPAWMIPRRTDRAVLVGTTGSGKTTLARFLLDSRPFVVVHDGKGRIDWPGYQLFTSLESLVKATRSKEDATKLARVIYRPTEEERANEEVTAAFFRWIFERGNTTLYVDEVYRILDDRTKQAPTPFLSCITAGREPTPGGGPGGIEVWSSTQRPANVPMVVLSESEHYYVFRMQLRDDRKRVEGVTGLDEELVSLLPKRQFYYVPTGEGARGPIQLQIEKPAGMPEQEG